MSPNPSGVVRNSAGHFYGVTTYGGKYAFGTVYRTTATGVMTTLVDFSGLTGANRGYYPYGRLAADSS
jgi:uncharacterized repeat protein (TIGR03803 family)